jgi:hypothetical protein
VTTQRLFSIGLLGCALAACQPASDSTKIILTVHSDLGVGVDIDSIRLDLTSDDRKVTPSPTFQLTSQASLPVRLAVIPAKGKDATFTVSAVALKGTTEVVFQQATSKFIAGKVGYIDLSLTGSCISKLCPGQTCSLGLCVDQQRPASLTPPDGGASADASPARDSSATGDVASGEDGGSVASKDVGGELGDGGTTPDSRVLLDTSLSPDVPVILPIDTAATMADTGPDAAAPVDAAIVVVTDTAVLTTDTALLPMDAGLPVDNAAPDAPPPVLDAPPVVETSACTPVLSLTAAGGNGVATLQWSGATSPTFQIWRGSAASGPLTSIGSTAGTSFTDSSGLPNGKSVFYQVSMGSSSPACANASNVAEAIPCAPPTVTPTTFGNDVTLRWTDTGASLYAISYGASPNDLSTTITTTALSSIIANLPKDQPIYAKVSSNNATCSTGDSQIVSATPTGCTAWPSKPVLTATLDSNRLLLNWAASTGGTGALTYALSFSTTAGGPYAVLSSAATSGYSHESLVNDTAYAYILTATDSLGCVSTTSDELTATPTLSACKALACEDFSTSSSDPWEYGDWGKSGGAICYNGSSVAARGDHAISGAPSFGSDQTIQAKIKLGYCSGATANAGAGIEVRAGSSNFYALTVDCDGVLRLRREYTILTGCEYTLPAAPTDTWRLLKLSVAGTTLSGYLDDMTTAKFTCTDTHNLSGNPGLMWRIGSTRFCADDLRVTSP